MYSSPAKTSCDGGDFNGSEIVVIVDRHKTLKQTGHMTGRTLKQTGHMTGRTLKHTGHMTGRTLKQTDHMTGRTLKQTDHMTGRVAAADAPRLESTRH